MDNGSVTEGIVEMIDINKTVIQDGLMQLLLAMLCLEALAEAGGGGSGNEDPVSITMRVASHQQCY